MYELGLKKHVKLLPPDQEWFAEAVKAGRAKIEKDHADNIIHLPDIHYYDSMEEAVEC